MSIIFVFFYSCFLLFLDFCRLIFKGFKRLLKREKKQPTQNPLNTENENEQAFNELLTIEELLEDD